MAESLQSLLDRYRLLAARHAATEFGSRASVRRGNAAADEMRQLATRLAASGQAGLAAFSDLLDESGVARSWAAHHILEVMAPDAALRRRALSAIEERGRGAGAYAYGERLWLQTWYEAHPEDRASAAPAV